MADRRRTTRYAVPEAAAASLLVMQDVYVERLAAPEIVVLADASIPPGTELTLTVPAAFETRRIPATVTAAGPSSRATSTRHPYRITLQVHDSEEEGLLLDPSQTPPSIGVLLRRVPVRVHDISIGGCLIEAAGTLPDGSIGVLELTVGGEQHSETLRVCRSEARKPGAAPARSGARFLALSSRPSTSVRNVVARFELLEELGAMPEALARVHHRGTTVIQAREAFSWSDAIALNRAPRDERLQRSE